VDDPAVRRPDIALAQELLDWTPTIELEPGLRLTLAGMGRGVPLAG
jgi:nucleoside-diphosphate-sugar epimerase